MAEKPKNSRKFRWIQEISPDGSIVNRPSYEVYTFKPPPSEIIEARVRSSLSSNTATSSSFAVSSSYASYALSASYAVSASHEIVKEISSSYADTASFAQSGDGIFSGSFSGSYEGDGSQLTGISTDPFPFVGDAVITGSLTITGSFNAFKLNANNVVLGPDAGTSLNAGGLNNVILGNSAASNLTTGDNNVIIGTNAGDGVGTGGSNVAIGRNAGFSALGNRSVLVGDQAGTQGGTDNVFLGYQAGAVGTGNYNVAIGTTALRGNSGGSNYSVAIGYEAGYRVGAGDDNILIGRNSGDLIVTGNANIIIGSGSQGASALERQLRIGHSDNIIISASLETGDIIFASTASSAYFVGDGSQLSGISTTPFPFVGDAVITGSLVVSASATSQSLSVIGSGSTVFDVIGSVGTLFSIDDDLNGMLFTANDISGFPVLQASASGDVFIGKTPQSLYTTAVVSSTIGSTTTESIYNISTSSYDGAFFEYTAVSASNARAGTILSVWTNQTCSFADTSTRDIGNTSRLTIKPIISGSTARLVVYGDDGYKVKTTVKAI